jgi:hypothetical protein
LLCKELFFEFRAVCLTGTANNPFAIPQVERKTAENSPKLYQVKRINPLLYLRYSKKTAARLTRSKGIALKKQAAFEENEAFFV